MRMVEKEARTKEEAIRLALEELKVKREQVRIETIEEGKGSFLGLGRSKPAKVRIYFTENGSDELINLVKEICSKMQVECNVSIAEENDNRIVLKLDSKDSGILIGKRGKNLEALQYLVNIISNSDKDQIQKILLDVEGYREKRRETLEKLARNLAMKVRKTRRPQILEEMNPYERRIIHMTLENDRDIETRSIGGENSNLKRIRIALRRMQR